MTSRIFTPSLADSCHQRQTDLLKLFETCSSDQAKYEKIMELGKTLPPLDPAYRTPENQVKGCQSIVYLHAYLNEQEQVCFQIESEALISAGLAALLVFVYQGQRPEVILRCPPTFIQELGLHTSLSPGRSNGLGSMYTKMKQRALQLLLQISK